MLIEVVTLFPEMLTGFFTSSILKKAQEKGLVTIRVHNLRQWSIDKRGSVDDKPYGGGVGMVIRPEPFFQAVASLSQNKLKKRIILLSASGKPYTQKKAKYLTRFQQLILLCGHYEGVDQRVADYLCDEEISIGDYILTGGEIPACVVVDSVVRLLKGVLPKKEATSTESFSYQGKLLEYPQYTRPADFQGYKVPQILLSGNHQKIAKWRYQKALAKTKKIRPELLGG